MKKLRTEEEYIKQLLAELGSERPSVDFYKSILERLHPNRTTSAYNPVISSLAWKIIGGAIVAFVFSVLLFLPGSENTTQTLFDQMPTVAIPQVAISLTKISIPIIDLSSIAIQSLVVFILLALLSVITTVKQWKIL